MKKLTQKQLLDLASALGLAGVELVENETDSEFNLDAALSLVDNSRKPIIESGIRGELESSIKGSIEGKAYGAIRAMLARNTGLSHSQMKAISEDNDKIEEVIKAAIAHKMSSVQGNQEDTAKKIEEMLTAWNKEKEELLTAEQKKYNELNEKYIGRDMLSVIEGKMKDAPLPQKLDRKIAAEDFMSHLRNKYHLSYDEAQRAIALMDKGNPAVPALNETRTQAVDMMAEMKSFFEPRALWVTDMRHVNPAEAMKQVQQPTPQGFNVPPANNVSDVDAFAAALNSKFGGS